MSRFLFEAAEKEVLFKPLTKWMGSNEHHGSGICAV
jgi:hypothetical protein